MIIITSCFDTIFNKNDLTIENQLDIIKKIYNKLKEPHWRNMWLFSKYRINKCRGDGFIAILWQCNATVRLYPKSLKGSVIIFPVIDVSTK